MAAEISKPDFSYQWSSGGAIVAPSNVKIQTGWTAEVPPFQWENYLQNRQDNAILHLFQKGISEWDVASNYYFTASGTRSYVQGSDGIIYVAVADSIGQDPTTDLGDTYWKVAFADNSTALTTVSGDARYTQRANNLSDVNNATTARSNLGIFLDNTRIDVASATTVNLTSSAPSTRHINITGTTTVTGFTVAIGLCYFVRFAGVLTLTNGASLVTQSGANIVTAVGDTCIIRATAANVVEILCYTPGIPQDLGYRQTWQNLTGSRAVATNYTNATGRPIEVSISVNTDINADLTVGGVVASSVNGLVGVVYVECKATIPAGAVYRIDFAAGGGGTILNWAELR